MARIERIGVSERNSRAVIYNNLVFLPGVVPGDNPPSMDIAEQAKITLEKVEKQHLNCLENLVQNAFCTIRN